MFCAAVTTPATVLNAEGKIVDVLHYAKHQTNASILKLTREHKLVERRTEWVSVRINGLEYVL